MKQFYTFFFVSLLIVLAVLSGENQLRAQYNPNPPKAMTLEQCVEVAMRDNLDIKNATLEISKTKYTTDLYTAKIFPSLSGNVDYRYNTDILGTVVPAESFGGKAGEYSVLQFGVTQVINAGLTLEQVIYNHAAFVGLKSIKPLREKSQLELDEMKDVIAYNVSSTFYSIEIAELQSELIKTNLSSLEQTFAKTKPLVDQGLLAQNELEKLNVQMERLKTQMVELEINKIKMYNMLKILMGMSAQENIVIVQKKVEELTEFYLVPPPPTMDNIRQTRIRKIGIDLLEIEKQATLSAYLPSVVFRANYGLTSYNTTFNPFESLNDTWFRSSYLALGIRVPIFQGLEGQYNRKIKNNQITQAKNSFAYFKKDLDRKINDAFNDYQYRKEIELSRKKIFESQTQIFKNESTLYEMDLTNIIAFIRAQDELSRERSEYIASLINLKRSELEYKKLINDILKK